MYIFDRVWIRDNPKYVQTCAQFLLSKGVKDVQHTVIPAWKKDGSNPFMPLMSVRKLLTTSAPVIFVYHCQFLSVVFEA